MAQEVELPFPTGLSGYDQQLGVTVQSRLRPEYDPIGFSAGTFTIRPSLDQDFIYNSNPTGTSGASSAGSRTVGAVSAASNWSRANLEATAGFTQTDYFSIPGLVYTDWNAGLKAGYTLGRGGVTGAYSHQTINELGTELGLVRSVTPAADQVDTGRLDYTFNLFRLSLTPELDVTSYRFGPATVQGVHLDQSFLNRDVFAGGLTARYELSESGSLVAMAKGVWSDFVAKQAGQPNNSSTSGLILSGFDLQPRGPFRYQVLVGVEVRSWTAAQFATAVTPTVEARVIWTPTEILTATAQLSRAIADPESAGTNGFVLDRLDLTADYELLRNVLLEGRGTVRAAEFFQQSTQTSYSLATSATWLLNRSIRLALSAEYTQQSGAGQTNSSAGIAATRSGAFSQTVTGLMVHFAL